MTAKPTLGKFEEIIEELASYPRIGPDSPDWVRDNITVGGDKLRILRYVLDNISHGAARKLLDVGTQIGAPAFFAASFGCKTSAVDYGFFAERYGKIAADS